MTIPPFKAEMSRNTNALRHPAPAWAISGPLRNDALSIGTRTAI